jgi:drug/metabolite transporter (DMT)-like permease
VILLNRSQILPIIKAIFAVSAWGASFIATKVSLQYISPVSVVWLRFGIGFFILWAAVVWRKQSSTHVTRDLPYLALLGFLGITFHQWLQSTGLITAQASTTAWIVAITPVFIALLGWVFLKESMVWIQWTGIALAALGVLLVVSEGDLSALSTGEFGTRGDFLILISSLNWAIFSIISRSGLQKYPAAWMMFYVMGFGWLFSSVLLFLGPGLSEIGQLELDGWLAIGFLGIVCSGLAYIFWYDALQAIPASRVGAFLYLEPLVAVVVAALVLFEPLLWASLLGGAIILLGVWMVNRPTREEEPVKQVAS